MNLTEHIRSSNEQPIFGIIGSASPTKDYNQIEGILVGYQLREFVGSQGTLFTGGVLGVGIDAYCGIMHYCNTHKLGETIPDDRFFVLVPRFIEDKNGGLHDFSVPEPYTKLSLDHGKQLQVIYAGDDFEQRRYYVAEVADALIALNGGHGTLDEAVTALEGGTPVISLPYTGGAAEFISYVDDKIISKTMKRKVKIDRSLLSIADSPDDMIIQLKKIVGR